MKFKDIETKTVEELNELLNDLRAESFALGWKNKTQQQDQTHKIRLVRRDIARVLTALKQKQTPDNQAIKKSESKKEIKTSTKTKTTSKAKPKTEKPATKKTTKGDK